VIRIESPRIYIIMDNSVHFLYQYLMDKGILFIHKFIWKLKFLLKIKSSL